MKLRTGICGFGGLGHLHANNMVKMDDVEIVAVCDIRPEQLKAPEVKTNLEAGNGPVFDVSSAKTYANYRLMLRKEKLDLLVTALPTDIHAKVAIAALEAGCHVFSEKPMALTPSQCNKMIAARDENNRELMIGQCLRFWPEYNFLLKAVRSNTYGKLHSLTMERIGGYASWSADNWFNDSKRSGGAILDLHLHDADWVNYALGKPAGIFAAGAIGKSGDFDDVTAIWDYEGGAHVMMRCSWMYSGFNMNFRAIFEKGIVEYGIQPDPALKVITPSDKKIEKPELEPGEGYSGEIRYLIECIQGKRRNEICTAESTRDSVELIFIERKSAQRHKRILLK